MRQYRAKQRPDHSEVRPKGLFKREFCCRLGWKHLLIFASHVDVSPPNLGDKRVASVGEAQ